jgi:hypothetical protein
MTQQTGRISKRKDVNAASSLPEIGKIKIGEKKVSAKGVEYPSALDYFRSTGTFANEFVKLFGEKPKKLNVCFISDDLAEVCNERYVCWENGKRWGEGDGETFMVFDKSLGDKDKEGKPKGDYAHGLPANDPRVRALKWDQMLTLRFVLLEMKGIMGYWRFETKAKAVTIPSIIKSFDLVRERAGSIIGFPFTLMVEKKIGYNPGEAKSYPVVTLVPNFTEDSINMVRDYIDMGGSMNRITSKMIQQEKVLDQLPKQIGSGEAKPE